MESETKHYAHVFERLGRHVLAQLSELPEIATRWPLPLPDGDSLFRRAVRLVEESAFWVLQVIGVQDQLYDQGVEEKMGGTLADLALLYESWFSALHQLHDSLPDASLDQPFNVPPAYQDLFDGETATLRACLLYALGQYAMQVGHIEFICQLFADGERVLIEVNEQIQDSMLAVSQPGDYS